MRRRDVLKYAGAGAAVGVTGCLSEGDGSPTNETDDGDDNNGTGNDGSRTTVTDTSFSVVSVGDGDGGELGSPGVASFRFDGKTLNVQGTVIGSDACKTAELESAAYNEDESVVAVEVNTVDSGDAGDCERESPTSIEYELTVEFEGEQPSVVVIHDGEEVEAQQGEPGGGKNNTELTGSEFEVTGSECGTETNEAKYTASQGVSEDEVSEGVIEGTLWGPDACTTAESGYVSYDSDEDTLVADVRTVRTDEDACADCTTEVGYRLVAEFENGVADAASVSHDGVVVDGVGDGIETSEFSVEGIQNSSGDERDSDAEFNEDEDTIVVRGTAVGADSCKTARLAEAYVEDGVLNVDVETVDTGGGMCTQVLQAIEYTATLTFEDGIPNEVSVSHDGEGVMGAAYESESVSAPPRNESE